MSRIHRVYCEHELIPSDTFVLSGESHHYLGRVLRIKAHDEVYFFNHLGKEFLCHLLSAEHKSSTFICEKEIIPLPEPAVQVQLNIAICKSESMALIVQKATELGVSIIQPMLSANNKHNKMRLNHLQSVARSATEQCRRVVIPTLHEPIDLSDIPPIKDSQQGIVLDPYASHPQSLSQSLTASAESIIVVIGSEGGWQSDEVDTLNQCGFNSIRLGSRILRSETAVISVLSLVQYQLGQLS